MALSVRTDAAAGDGGARVRMRMLVRGSGDGESAYAATAADTHVDVGVWYAGPPGAVEAQRCVETTLGSAALWRDTLGWAVVTGSMRTNSVDAVLCHPAVFRPLIRNGGGAHMGAHARRGADARVCAEAGPGGNTEFEAELGQRTPLDDAAERRGPRTVVVLFVTVLSSSGVGGATTSAGEVSDCLCAITHRLRAYAPALVRCVATPVERRQVRTARVSAVAWWAGALNEGWAAGHTHTNNRWRSSRQSWTDWRRPSSRSSAARAAASTASASGSPRTRPCSSGSSGVATLP